MRRPAIVGLTLANLAFSAPGAAQETRIYLRSNSDGTEAETIAIHLAAPGRVEVIKTRDRCLSAAYVIAQFDPATGEALKIVGGRLGRAGEQQPQAWLSFDPAAMEIRAVVGREDAPPALSTPVSYRPWLLYDFDLATLVAAPPAAIREKLPFSFGLVLLLTREGAPSLADLGRIDARFTAVESFKGRQALRFEFGGPALPVERGGPAWFDPNDGRLLGARWGLPNHAEYRDFSFNLLLTRHGAAAWENLRRAHHAGCPPPRT